MPWTFLLLHSTYSLVVVQTLSFLLNSELFIICATVVENCHHGPAFLYCINTCGIHLLLTAAEVTLSNLTLASRTDTTLSVTWSAGYSKCYSFTVSHSTQDGFVNVTKPADSDTSHTLTSLQPGTTYRIEVEAVRKGDGADGQRAKVIGNFATCKAKVGQKLVFTVHIIRTYAERRVYWGQYVYNIWDFAIIISTYIDSICPLFGP